MSDLDQFRAKLKTSVRAAETAPRWPSPELERYMAAFEVRREQFQATSQMLVSDVIKPRLSALMELFPNARAITDNGTTRYCCWLASSDRFPVTGKIEFSVEHDEALQNLFVRYDAALMPVFFKFQPHDRLSVRLGQVDEEHIANWVEMRTLEFLETYLRYDRGAEDLEEDIVTDPVCGMRLSRTDVRETTDYRGHAYFFCSQDCKSRFAAGPTNYVKLITS